MLPLSTSDGLIGIVVSATFARMGGLLVVVTLLQCCSAPFSYCAWAASRPSEWMLGTAAWLAVLFVVALACEGPGQVAPWRVALVQGCSASLAMYGVFFAVVAFVQAKGLPAPMLAEPILLFVAAFGLWPRSIQVAPAIGHFVVAMAVFTTAGVLAVWLSFGLAAVVGMLLSPEMSKGDYNQTLVAITALFATLIPFVVRQLRKVRGFSKDISTMETGDVESETRYQTKLLEQILDVMQQGNAKQNNWPPPLPPQKSS
jgi:hypothetical protein